MTEGQLKHKPVLCSYWDIGAVMLDNKYKKEDRKVMEGKAWQLKPDIRIWKGWERCLEPSV